MAIAFPAVQTATHTAVIGTLVVHGGVVSGSIEYSYSAAPAAGSSLTVSDGANTLVTSYIGAAGPGSKRFKYAVQADPRATATLTTTLTFTLADGGSAVIGSLEFIRD